MQMLKEKNSEVLAEIDSKLAKIRELKIQAETIKAESDNEMKKIKAKYSKKLQVVKSEIDRLDKEIKGLMKRKRAEIFAGGDTAELQNGKLYFMVRQVVRKARNVTVSLLKSLGYADGIRIEEYVDWSKIEKWPDERLAAIGTERMEKEEFKYELYSK
ncbi:hypothetical protein FHQ18_11570 [Deferribacter autotrophicus]|uniref:Host-nuclease inhibitor protein Gam n=1 Tax=Deferribacter autotrophicus TaxID=500465 RepID=A0A5A8F1G9_9BACT|nr:host-nuclease inhibitor Gam family protein [Deferribacter autotrophicus]KAA0257196.1 hypothetical protein FHQ18_11570 [Deferribacter autotrophicus]